MFDDLKAARISILLLIVSGVFVYGLFWSANYNNQISGIEQNVYVSTGMLDENSINESGTIAIEDIPSIESDDNVVSTGVVIPSLRTTGAVRNALLSGSLDDIRNILDDKPNAVTDISSGQNINTGIREDISLSERNLLKDQGIPLLSGTESYFETVESFDRIGVVPRMVFALAKEDMYFGLLNTGTYDWPRIARSLNGNALAFVTEKVILENNFPGKAVVFINLPQYKDKIVIMVVDTGTYKRIIQLPKKNYHQSKNKLKNILGSAGQ